MLPSEVEQPVDTPLLLPQPEDVAPSERDQPLVTPPPAIPPPLQARVLFFGVIFFSFPCLPGLLGLCIDIWGHSTSSTPLTK